MTESEKVCKRIYSKRMLAIQALGGVCVRCGFTDIRALQIDHINGGGFTERKTLSPYRRYLNIISNPVQEKAKYQILCANCNQIKRIENKEVKNGNLHI